MKRLIDLVERLTKLDEPVEKQDETVEALEVAPSKPEGYVWPGLRDVDIAVDARVVLIEAAGAVGKTAAANALASELNWPLVDAAQAQVGSYSLSGLVHDALGLESTFLSEVASGRAGLIVDALDEAHLRAGTSNFQAFLDNARRLASGAGLTAPNLVLFSRPDTADLVRLFFKEKGSPLTSATIEFFDYPQARDFVFSFMSNQAKLYPDRDYGLALRNPESLGDLRDMRMKEIASALLTASVDDLEDCWPEVQSFLGYAPVLAVLGEYLAVRNPKAEQSLSIGGKLTARNVLLKIVSNLLKREHEKFQGQVNQKLSALLPPEEEWIDSKDAYGAEEQSVRLVSRRLDLTLAVPPPVTLPPSMRQQYEWHADQFLADHPFIAGRDAVNVVFDDYIKAKAAVDLNCITSLKPNPRGLVTDVGPFFYQFVHEFATSDAGDSLTAIDEALVPLVLSSHAQSVAGTDRDSFAYFQSGEEATLILSGEQPGQQNTIAFDVTELSGILPLVDRVSRGIVITDGGIVLSTASSFLLGPGVALVCNELEIDADVISVDPTVQDGRPPASIIKASKISVPKGKLSVDAPRPDSLEIYGEHDWPALRRFLREPSKSLHYVKHSRIVDLRAILRVFQQGLGHAPSVFVEKMDQGVVKSNPDRIAFLKKLQELKVLSRTGVYYYLDKDALSGYGVKLSDVINGRPTVSIVKFIDMLSGGADL